MDSRQRLCLFELMLKGVGHLFLCCTPDGGCAMQLQRVQQKEVQSCTSCKANLHDPLLGHHRW